MTRMMAATAKGGPLAKAGLHGRLGTQRYDCNTIAVTLATALVASGCWACFTHAHTNTRTHGRLTTDLFTQPSEK